MQLKLTIHLEKSHYMIFHRSRLKDCDKRDFIIQDRIISHVTSTKFLGVIIDDKLKWNLHIIYMKNKIANKIVCSKQDCLMAFYTKLEISWIEKH